MFSLCDIVLLHTKANTTSCVTLAQSTESEKNMHRLMHSVSFKSLPKF